AAERDQELRVARDDAPRGRLPEDRTRAPDDVRQQHQRRADAVAVDRRGEAADQREEAVELALRLVEETGARPAVRAAAERLVAVLRDAPAVLVRGAIPCLLPRERNEGVGAAVARRSRAALEPAAAGDRAQHARGMADAPREVREERRRVGVV